MDQSERYYLSFLETDETSIRKSRLLNDIKSCGFLNDDPRLNNFKQKLNEYQDNIYLTQDEFYDCIDSNICILNKIFKKDLIIPDFKSFTNHIETIYKETLKIKDGDVASYIPQLARADPDQYGISICTIDGQRYNVGDTNVDFTVQSCTKIINYGNALEELGTSEVHKFVGREPSGQAFNELTLNKEGKPHNPLINSGAIMTTSLIKNKLNHADRFDYVMDIWSKLSGGIYKIGFNNSVYLSEKKTADRNYALAYFMKETNDKKIIGFPENTDLDQTLELYFQCCSIEVTTEILSIVASTLANGGVNPFTGEKVWSPDTVKNVLSMMLMCGMYDYSGEHAFKIGIPSKSGVAGAIMTVIPNVMGIVTWSPRLDSIGNSIRGVEFCKWFGDWFNFHIFDNQFDDTKMNPLEDKYNSFKIHEFSELCESAKNGDLDYLRKLFNKGIDMSQKDYDGRTALHLASSEGHSKVVDFLVTIAKVDIKPIDRWGNSPLDDAVKNKFTEIVAILSEIG